jgi:hypothetical protein
VPLPHAYEHGTAIAAIAQVPSQYPGWTMTSVTAVLRVLNIHSMRA